MIEIEISKFPKKTVYIVSKYFSTKKIVQNLKKINLGEIGPESDEDFPAPGRKRSRKSKGAKGGLGSFGSGRKTRKSRAKHVSMDDDYDSIEPAHYCGLCGKVNYFSIEKKLLQ